MSIGTIDWVVETDLCIGIGREAEITDVIIAGDMMTGSLSAAPALPRLVWFREASDSMEGTRGSGKHRSRETMAILKMGELACEVRWRFVRGSEVNSLSQ